jgi:xylan 1,4-beta-xylosidase
MTAIDVLIKPDRKAGDLGTFWKKVVGCGSAFLLTRKDLLDHVEDAVDSIGFEYLRFHGILSDDVGLVQQVDKDANEIDVDCLNFTNVDAIFDALMDIGIKPFVELSFMPAELASGTTQVFKYPSNVTPPVKLSLWSSLIHHLVAHWRDRYGADEVQDWYFEVWNEPNLRSFWTGTMEEYFALYEHAARAIKAIDAHFKVGGPASAAGGWIAPFLAYCKARDVPVDFTSTHVYQVDTVPQGGRPSTHVNSEPGEKPFSSMHEVLARARAEVKASAFPALALHVTEWGSSVSPFDAMHDTTNQAAFACSAITIMNGLVDSFSYWTVSDIFEEMGLPDRAFHGGFGLITIQGVHKPVFNAFSFMNQLGSELVEGKVTSGTLPTGARFIATRTGKDVRVLAWYFARPGIVPKPSPVDVSLQIEKAGIFNGAELDFSMLEIGKHKANAYEAWKEMGSPRNPTPVEIEDLRQFGEIDDDDEVMQGVASQDEARMTIHFTLEPESVKFIRIFTGSSRVVSLSKDQEDISFDDID